MDHNTNEYDSRPDRRGYDRSRSPPPSYYNESRRYERPSRDSRDSYSRDNRDDYSSHRDHHRDSHRDNRDSHRDRDRREYRESRYPRHEDRNVPVAPLADLAGSDKALIYNLPPTFAWQDLKDLLREHCRVIGVDKVGPTSAIARFSDTNECIRAAAVLHNTLFRGEPMYFSVPDDEQIEDAHRKRPVQDTERVPVDPSLRVYVFGLPFSYELRDIKNLLSKFGDHYVDIRRDGQGRSRGFAIARFNNAEDAQACIDGLNNTVVERRTLSVRLDKAAANDTIDTAFE